MINLNLVSVLQAYPLISWGQQRGHSITQAVERRSLLWFTVPTLHHKLIAAHRQTTAHWSDICGNHSQAQQSSHANFEMERTLHWKHARVSPFGIHSWSCCRSWNPQPYLDKASLLQKQQKHIIYCAFVICKVCK